MCSSRETFGGKARIQILECHHLRNCELACAPKVGHTHLRPYPGIHESGLPRPSNAAHSDKPTRPMVRQRVREQRLSSYVIPVPNNFHGESLAANARSINSSTDLTPIHAVVLDVSFLFGLARLRAWW